MNATNFKLAGIFAAVATLMLLFGTGSAVAGFTHVFNLAAVGVFVVASTIGLATRLRA